jgi:methionyl-tRNA formyltransferase
MTVCFFSSHASAENRNLIRSILTFHFDSVVDIFSKDSLPAPSPESILISDRTTFFFDAEYLSCFKHAFNVHPSLLPLHKGSFPILWACLENDPCGVSIHSMNGDVDAGDIVWQSVVPYSSDESLSSVFYRCRQYIVDGLHKTCLNIVSDNVYNKSIKQIPDSFHHLKNDGLKILECFPNGWQTTIADARAIYNSSESFSV